MKNVIRVIALLAFLTPASAQEHVGQYLSKLPTYEARDEFYTKTTLSINEVKAMMDSTDNDLIRLELIQLYLRRQYQKDISLGAKEAMEALSLAKSLKLPMHQALAYR